ncbi:MAG: hypothetical protein IPN69_09635 [Acidobacteria bacterium]|nr:hypothetical protein [Acidobacteriota bacterium]MBK8150018.1 hypothetical protein [Acidobacteriota bacterium]MBK8810977.1 hypothetical protein [Acidobacteriota bacterium]
MKRIAYLAIVLAVTAVAGFGQLDGNPENMCRNGFFPRESESYSLAKVKAKRGARVYFYGDDDDCPNGKNCRTKSYLIAKNEVIVSREFGKWACVWYQPAKGSETVGWIALSNLDYVALPGERGPSAWIGKWTYYDSTIEIAASKTKDVYGVKGTAFWRGLGDNIHIGELDGTAKYANGKLNYGWADKGEYDCRATFNAVGRFMVVSDNLNCGGANVSFSGVYRRK